MRTPSGGGVRRVRLPSLAWQNPMTTTKNSLPDAVKTAVPASAGMLARPRLEARLAETDAPAKWLVAPSGTGKSTLVASYARGTGRTVVWYRLDPRDDDPAYFYRPARVGARRSPPKVASASAFRGRGSRARAPIRRALCRGSLLGMQQTFDSRVRRCAQGSRFGTLRLPGATRGGGRRAAGARVHRDGNSAAGLLRCDRRAQSRVVQRPATRIRTRRMRCVSGGLETRPTPTAKRFPR